MTALGGAHAQVYRYAMHDCLNAGIIVCLQGMHTGRRSLSPKSLSLHSHLLVTSRLVEVRSLWTTPCSWVYDRAAAACRARSSRRRQLRSSLYPGRDCVRNSPVRLYQLCVQIHVRCRFTPSLSPSLKAFHH